MLSVITIFYNSEQFLEKCVRSYAAQSRKDFEVLFVNDGSTDRSLSVLEESLKGTELDFKILSHDVNYGISVARNTGLDAVSGDIVSFVDSDDYIEPDYIDTLLRAHEDSSHDLMLFGVNKFNNDIGRGDNHAFGLENEVVSFKEYLKRVGFNLPGYYYVQMVFRKEIIDANRLRFFPGCSPGEDVEFMLKYFCYVDTIFSIPDVLYTYVIHGSNVTSRSPARFNYHYWGITERLHSWLEAHTEIPGERREMVNMGIAKYYKRLFSNSWKHRIREFKVGNPRVKASLVQALKYPYLEKSVRSLFRGMVLIPWAVRFAFRIKGMVERK